MAQQINWREREKQMLDARSKRVAETVPVILSDFSRDLGEEVAFHVRHFEIGEEAAFFGAPEHLASLIAKRTPEYLSAMASMNIVTASDGSVDPEDVEARERELVAKGASAIYLPEFVNMVNTVCLASCADPVIVETEAERAKNPNAVLLMSLTYGDRLQIFYGAQRSSPTTGGEGAILGQFREKPGTDVENSQTQQDAKTPKRRSRTKRGGVDGTSAA